MPTTADLPKYWELMYPVLRAVDSLGGSAHAHQITERVIEIEGFPEPLLQLLYPNKPKSILVHRLEFARSRCKLSGVFDSPQRAFFVITELGRELLGRPEVEAREELRRLDRLLRVSRSSVSPDGDGAPDDPADDAPLLDEAAGESEWRDELIVRLWNLSPGGFERFCIFLLGLYDYKLEHRGGTGDGGIDGLGTAPITKVSSTTVALQAKKYGPSNPVGREAVALFQRDAARAGAERAVFMTTGRFSKGAEQAARETRPTVDLINGERICDLVIDRQPEIAGLQQRYFVNDDWFGRFEPSPTPRP
ncbi:MAG: restriction endonuclease [Dehalococcoidia bacterium]|nr:restriction endonuclease [Dehalococcoidia bacterium]